MSFFSKLGQRVSTVLVVIGTVPLLIMMVIIVGNSLGRALFKAPISGTLEIAGLAGAVIVAASVGFTARERGNVSVDVLMSRLGRRARAVFDAIAYFLSLGAVFFLLWAVVRDIITSVKVDEASMTMSIPIAPFKIAWALGILITACFLIAHIVAAVQNWRKK